MATTVKRKKKTATARRTKTGIGAVSHNKGYRFFCQIVHRDVETKEYSYVDLPNPKPFMKFSIKSFEDIENGTEKLQNL